MPVDIESLDPAVVEQIRTRVRDRVRQRLGERGITAAGLERQAAGLPAPHTDLSGGGVDDMAARLDGGDLSPVGDVAQPSVRVDPSRVASNFNPPGRLPTYEETMVGSAPRRGVTQALPDGAEQEPIRDLAAAGKAAREELMRMFPDADPVTVSRLPDADALKTLAEYKKNPQGVAQEAPSIDRGTVGNLVSGLNQGAAVALRMPGLPVIGGATARWADQAAAEPEAPGAAGFVGRTLGGFAGILNPAHLPENVAAAATGGLLTRGVPLAMEGVEAAAGPVGRGLGPVLDKIGKTAGPRVAAAVERIIGNAGPGGALAGMQQAERETWEDPIASAKRVLEATGVGALTTAAGGELIHPIMSRATRAVAGRAEAPKAADATMTPEAAAIAQEALSRVGGEGGTEAGTRLVEGADASAFDPSTASYGDLRREASRRGLDPRGTRSQLMERLREPDQVSSEAPTRGTDVRSDTPSAPEQTRAAADETSSRPSSDGTTESLPPAGSEMVAMADAASPESTPDYASMSFPDLRREATAREIETRGNRDALIRRLEADDARRRATEVAPVESAADIQPKENSNVQPRQEGRQEEGQAASEGLLKPAETTATPPASEGAGGSLAQRLDAVAERARQRIKERAIPRGRNVGSSTLPQDVIDAAVYAIAKAASKGVTAGKALSQAVRTHIGELWPERATDDAFYRKVRSVAKGALKDMGGDPTKLEDILSRVMEHSDELTTQKDRVAAVMEVQPKKVAPEPIRDLRAQFRSQQKAADAGFKAGRAQGAADEAYRSQYDRRGAVYQAEQKAAKDLAAAEKDKTRTVYRYAEKAAAQAFKAGRAEAVTEYRARIEEIRKQGVFGREQVRAVRDTIISDLRDKLPQSMHGKYLTEIRDAGTYPKLRKVLNRIDADLASYQARTAIGRAESAVKASGRTKMLDEYKGMVEEAKKELATIRAQIKSAKTIAARDALRDRAVEVERKAKEARQGQKNSEQIRLTEATYQREKLIAELAPQIRAAGKQIPSVEGLDRTKQAQLWGKIKQAHMTPDTVGAMMGNTVARKLLSEELWDGETLVHGAVQRGTDAMRSWMEEAGYQWGSDQIQRLSEAASGAGNAEELTFKLPNAGEVKMTPAEAMALYATVTDGRAGGQIMSGTPITFERAKRGQSIKMNASDVSNFVYALDPKLREVVDKAKQYVERNVRPGVFKAFREQKGYDLERVPNYWRTRRNMTKATTMREDGIISMGKAMDRELTNLGFLQERVPSSSIPYVIGDFFGDFADMVHKGAVVEHMTRRVRNAELVFGDQRIADEIHDRFGEGMNRRIERIINNGKLVFKEPQTKGERIATGILKNYARAMLTVNPTVWAKQYSGIAKLGALIDLADLKAGVGKMNNAQARSEMMESPFFKERYDGAVWRRVSPALGERIPMLGESTVGNVAKRLVNGDVAAAGELIDRIKLLDWFDQQVATVAYAARKAQAVREHPEWSAERAKAWAQKAAEYDIRRTNNTSSPLDMSGWAEEHRGSLTSAFTMFTSDANKTANMLMTAAHEGTFGRTAAAVAVSSAFAAMITAMRSYLRQSGSPDKKGGPRRQSIAERFGRSLTRDLAGMGYFGGDVYDAAEAVADAALGLGSKRTVDIFRNPIVEPAQDVVNGLLQIMDAVGKGGRLKSGPDRGKSRLGREGIEGGTKIITGVGKMIGVPLEPPMKLIRDAIRALGG